MAETMTQLRAKKKKKLARIAEQVTFIKRQEEILDEMRAEFAVLDRKMLEKRRG